MTTFTKVRRYKRSVGKRCMHCGRSATVTAVRRNRTDMGALLLNVWYCDEHADTIIGVSA